MWVMALGSVDVGEGFRVGGSMGDGEGFRVGGCV